MSTLSMVLHSVKNKEIQHSNPHREPENPFITTILNRETVKIHTHNCPSFGLGKGRINEIYESVCRAGCITG